MLEQMQRQIMDFLTPATARQLADYFRAIASDFEHVVQTLEHRENERDGRRRRRARLRRIYSEVEALKDDGRELDAALAELSFAHDEPIETIRAHYELGAKLAGKLKRERRNREIARLARQGLTNAEIGERLEPQLHPRTVARILRVALLSADGPAPAPTKSLLDASVNRPARAIKMPSVAVSTGQLAEGLQSMPMHARALIDVGSDPIVAPAR
jgi:hypothetical protein